MRKPIVVAEVGINHNGDLEIAKANIGLAAGLGADYVKFQKRTVNVVYTPEYLAGSRDSPWGTTQRQQKEGLEFSKVEYDEIVETCKHLSIGWLCTPFDNDSLDFVLQYDPDYIKIASADLTNIDLLKAIHKSGKQAILSTGMSTKTQIDAALDALGGETAFLLHCVSTYPTPREQLNLSRVLTLQQDYGERCQIGYSHHSVDIIGIVAAMVLGAELVEFHVTIDRNLYGSDQQVSIGPTGFKRIMDHIKTVQLGWGDGSLEPRPSEYKVMKKLRRFP